MLLLRIFVAAFVLMTDVSATYHAYGSKKVSCPKEQVKKVHSLYLKMPRLTFKQIYWLYKNTSRVPHRMHRTVGASSRLYNNDLSGPLVKGRTAGLTFFPWTSEGIQHVQPPSGLVGTCDVYVKMQQAVEYLLSKCRPSPSGANAFLYRRLLQSTGPPSFWCPLLDSPKGDAILNCLSRRLMMSETFFCYLISHYSTFRDVRLDSFVLRLLE